MRKIKGLRAFSSAERRAIRIALIKKYGPYCQICIKKGAPRHSAVIDMQTRRETNSFSIDHIIALADGGANHITNMQPSHQRCNERKGSSQNSTHATPRVSYVTPTRLAYTSSSY